VADLVAKSSLPDELSQGLLALQRDRNPRDTRPRVMSRDERIVKFGRHYSRPSSLSRHVATPQSVILEERNLDKVQTFGSETTVAFFKEAQYVACFLVENPSVRLHMEQGHDLGIDRAAPKDPNRYHREKQS